LPAEIERSMVVTVAKQPLDGAAVQMRGIGVLLHQVDFFFANLWGWSHIHWKCYH